jgi:aldose 1-epimerase
MRAGNLLEIADGGRQAVVTEQGAGLFKLRWDGAELLDTSAEDGFSGAGCYGQVLAPWPGRVRNATYEYEGERYHLPADDRVTGASIHGLARWAAWQPVEQAPGSVTLRCRLLALPGYPFPFEYEQSYAWQKDCLEVVFRAKNIGDRTAPFGYGCHPYFSVGAPLVDETILQVPASKYFEAEPDLTPAGDAVPVDGSPFDFRQPRLIGPAQLDTTLADLARDSEGGAAVHYGAADGGVSITCTYYEPIKFVQLYSGDTLPAGRRRSLAIEPYTCVPDAFNNGIGLIHVQPGGEVKVRWTVAA